jgi:hypothetical protein
MSSFERIDMKRFTRGVTNVLESDFKSSRMPEEKMERYRFDPCSAAMAPHFSGDPVNRRHRGGTPMRLVAGAVTLCQHLLVRAIANSSKLR